MTRYFLLLFFLFGFTFMFGEVNAADRTLVKKCERCHGAWGLSQVKEIPRLAGMSSDYIYKALKRFEAKKRPCRKVTLPLSSSNKKSSMCEVAASLSADQKRDMARFFSNARRKSASQAYNETLAEKGGDIHDKLCEKCHTDAGTDPLDDAGLLAGQWMPYLRHAFNDFDRGRRPIGKKMKRRYRELSAEDKKALIHFYASIGGAGSGSH